MDKICEYLYCSFDTVETMWGESVGCWSFHQLEVTESGELEAKVLKRIGSLVDDKNVEKDIESVDLYISLRINRVREACRDAYYSL